MIHAYTDGSVKNGKGGSSVHFPGTQRTVHAGVNTDDIILAELKGVLMAAQHAPEGRHLHVHTDSSGIPSLLKARHVHPRSDMQALITKIHATVEKRRLVFKISWHPRENRFIEQAHHGARQARVREKAPRAGRSVTLDIKLDAGRTEAQVRVYSAERLQTTTFPLDRDLGVDLPLQALALALEHLPAGTRAGVKLGSPLTRAYLERGKRPTSSEVRAQVRSLQRLIAAAKIDLHWLD